MPAPAFRPDRIGEGYKPASYYKRSNILRRFCHQKKRKEVDPHYQQYYQGRLLTDVTDYLKPSLPGSPFKEPVFFPHKATDVTELYEKAGKLPKRPASAPDYSHGVRNSDVTEIYRHIPPAHLGKEPARIRLPYFGIRTSSVTDPSRFVDTSGLPLLSWWENQPYSKMPPRPQTAPSVVYPQHMNPTVLQKCILERKPYCRSEFIEEKRLYRPSEPPSTPRSELGSVKDGGMSDRRKRASETPRSARTHISSSSSVRSLKSDVPPPSTVSGKSRHSVKSMLSNGSAKQEAVEACSKKSGASNRQVAMKTCTPPPSSKASHVTKSSTSGSGGKPPRPPLSTRTSLGGFPSLTAEALQKLGPEKMDRVTKWAGELQTWAIPENRRPPKPAYVERDHGRKKTDVTESYVW